MKFDKKFKIKNNRLINIFILALAVLTLIKNLLIFELRSAQMLIFIRLNKVKFQYLKLLFSVTKKNFLMLASYETIELVLKFSHYPLKYLGVTVKFFLPKIIDWFKKIFHKKFNIKLRSWNFQKI